MKDARSKAYRFLTSKGLIQRGKKYPDSYIAELIYCELNSTSKHFSNEDAQKYLSNIQLSQSCVYAIGSLDYGYVKIGFSTNVFARIKQIQTGCPFPVSIIKRWPGLGRKEEKLLHKSYSKYKSNGEWFKIEGSLKHELLD